MKVITGTARGKNLKELKGEDTRPTTARVKEALFSILHFSLPQSHVLDLFSGTGQLGIEALSRGAAHCTFVDTRKQAVSLIRENLACTGLSQSAAVHTQDGLQFLNTCTQSFDIIFLDPPYATDLLERALYQIDKFDILRTNGIIICESSANKEFPCQFQHFAMGKQYRYGQIMLTTFYWQGM